MQKNNGVSLITLIVMIAVVLILSSIFISTGLDALKESKNSEVKNEIYQLKQAVVNKYTSYEKNNGNVILVGTLAKNKWTNYSECITEIYKTLEFDKETEAEKEAKRAKISGDIARDYDTFVKLIYSGDMAKLGLESFSDENVYIVDYYTGSVYGPISE